MNKITRHALTAGTITLAASPAFAVDKTIADVFLAADISTLNSNVYTLLAAVVVIGLMFVGKKYIFRSLGR